MANSKNELVYKIAIPLLETKSAKLRINAIHLLNRMLNDQVNLGMITRKNVKAKAEHLVTSECYEEVDAASLLCSTLLSRTATGELTKYEKFVTSCLRLVKRASLAQETTAAIICNSPLFIHNPELVLVQLLKENTLQKVITEDAFECILALTEQLHGEIVNLHDLARGLLKVSEGKFLEKAYSWYLNLDKRQKISISETELERLPLKYSSSPKLIRLTLKLFPSLVKDGSLRLRLVCSFFAQIKGDLTLVEAGESSISAMTFYSFSAVLSSLIASKTFGLDTLYESKEVLFQISEWAMGNLTKIKEFQKDQDLFELSFWSILGSMPSLQDPKSILETHMDQGSDALKVGPLIFIRHVLDNQAIESSALRAFFASIVSYLQGIWSQLSKADLIKDNLYTFELLVQTTCSNLHLAPLSLLETAAQVICIYLTSFPYEQIDASLLVQCQEILTASFKVTSIASQKYRLSQFSSFSNQPEYKETIFRTLVKILPVIIFDHSDTEDGQFFTETVKQIIFPFVYSSEEELQNIAANGLSLIVTNMKSLKFRDAVLQELIDRALNERKEQHRRGYIIGIGHVYPAMPELGSHLDLGTIVGFLSSLAKDHRSIIVQSAAVSALIRVLNAQSHSVSPVITSDIIYLIWQIFMTDSDSIPIDNAIDDRLLNSLALTLLVMIEMLGPDLKRNSTISSICRLMTGDLLEYDNIGAERLKALIDASIQILLVRQSKEGLQPLVSALMKILTCSEKLLLPGALSCLRWMIEFCRDLVIKEFSPPEASIIFNISAIASFNSDLQFCQDCIFTESFPKAPLKWLNLIQTSKVLRPAIQNKTGSSMSMDNEVVLLSELSLSTTDISILSKHSLKTVDSLVNVARRIISYLREEKETVLRWDTDICNNFFNEIVRLSLSLVLVPSKRNHSRELKSLGIEIISNILETFTDAPDPLDPDSSLLSTYQSQIVTLFSTACQDQESIMVSFALSQLNRCLENDKVDRFLRSHPKFKVLNLKMFEILGLPESHFVCNTVELYCKAQVLASICRRFDELPEDLDQRTIDACHWCLSQSFTAFIDEDLNRMILEYIPIIAWRFVNHDDAQNGVCSSKEAVYFLNGIIILLSHAPRSPYSIKAIGKMIECLDERDDLFQMVKYMILDASFSNDAQVISSLIDTFPRIPSLLDRDSRNKSLLRILSQIQNGNLKLKDVAESILTNFEQFDQFQPILFELLLDNFDVDNLFVAALGVRLFNSDSAKGIFDLLFHIEAGLKELRFAVKTIQAGMDNKLFHQQCVRLMRHLLLREDENTLRFWSRCLKSEDVAVQQVAHGSLDLILERGHVDKRVLKFIPPGTLHDHVEAYFAASTSPI